MIANSFPKSGTNLLVQILQGLPELRDWGLFLASTPSFTFREVAGSDMARKIEGTANRELVGAHLFYSPEVERALSWRGAAHYFVYRDPRDVVVSDAYYLSGMNRWHRLHKYFRALPTLDERIRFAITGFERHDPPFEFWDIGSRFEKYKPWIRSEDVCAVRYEDLCAGNTENWVRRIVQFYEQRACADIDHGACVEQALNNIDPKRSPTFRKGRTGGWQQIFTSEHKKLFKDYAGKILIEFGYEKDLDW